MGDKYKEGIHGFILIMCYDEGHSRSPKYCQNTYSSESDKSNQIDFHCQTELHIKRKKENRFILIAV